MGEIRSTLDIIMEKTKGLTASEEEKKAFRKKELRGKIQGLVQKYLDGLLNVGDIESTIESESAEQQSEMKILMIDILLQHLDPLDDTAQDNDRVLDLLAKALKMDIAPYFKLLEDMKQRMAGEKTARLRELKKQLAQKGVSGTAVEPNLLMDASWPAYIEGAKEAFQKRLRSI
jgi:hypothetical protein